MMIQSMRQSMMAMMLLTEKCGVSAKKLHQTLKSDERLVGKVKLPTSVDDFCFRLEFVTPIETTDRRHRPVTVTHISVSFVPDKCVQRDVNNPSTIETALVGGTDLVYSEALRHEDVCRYSTVDELVEMIIWIADGNSDPVEPCDEDDEYDEELCDSSYDDTYESR
jgi:hypothetical protein